MSFHKPLPLELSPKARQDLIDILRYTGEKWGQQQLLAYRARVDDALQAIRHNPELGHGRDDLPPTCQAYLVGSHVIVYRVGKTHIGVVRILHQRSLEGASLDFARTSKFDAIERPWPQR